LLAGLLTDGGTPDYVRVCVNDGLERCSSVAVRSDNSWQAAVGSYDGVTATVQFVGYDAAGNTSTPISRTLFIDTVAPTIGTITLHNTDVSSTDVVIASGAVPSGVTQVAVQLVTPSGNVETIVATIANGSWTAGYAPAEPGAYNLVVRMTDAVGNAARKAAGSLVVNGQPTGVSLSAMTATLSLPLLLVVAVLAALGMAVIWRWRVVRR
jgi:hypothetical protein